MLQKLHNYKYQLDQQCIHFILKDVRDEKEFQVSHLHKAHHVNPALKDMEQVIKLVTETGVNCISKSYVCLVRLL